MRMMGPDNLRKATQVAILSANYIAKKLEGHYDVLYRGANNFVAHECILDLRHLKKTVGIDVTDIAKRLMDYGFHAPTVSFPVVETLMVEPTESESKEELDRFCEALISIKKEIDEVSSGLVKAEESPLKNAPHTAERLTQAEWSFKYSREKAVFPLSWVRENKFWPHVSRIDNAYGDRNLFCVCGSPEDYKE
jgi:glycine dehydrogenase